MSLSQSDINRARLATAHANGECPMDPAKCIYCEEDENDVLSIAEVINL